MSETENTRRSPAAKRRPRSFRIAVVVLGAAILIGVGVGVGLLVWHKSGTSAPSGGVDVTVVSGAGGSHTLIGPTGDAFRITYPGDWRRVATPAIASSVPIIAAIRQKAGRGEILIRRDAKVAKLDRKFVVGLDRQLRGSISDYRFVNAEIIHLKQGDAFFYSYVRTRKGTLSTITLVPAGDHSYVIDTISAASSKDVANQIGQIIRTFKKA